MSMLGLGIALVRREETRLARVLSDLHLLATGSGHQQTASDTQRQARAMRSKLFHRSIPIALSRVERSLTLRRRNSLSCLTTEGKATIDPRSSVKNSEEGVPLALLHQVDLTRAIHFFDSERARYFAEESASLQRRIADITLRLKQMRESKRARLRHRNPSNDDKKGASGDDITALVQLREATKQTLEQLVSGSIVARSYLSARLWKRLLLRQQRMSEAPEGAASERDDVAQWLLRMQCTTHTCRTVLEVIRSGGALNSVTPRFVASPRRATARPSSDDVGSTNADGSVTSAEKKTAQSNLKNLRRARFLPKPVPHLLLPLCWDSCAHVLQTCEALASLSDEMFQRVLLGSPGDGARGLHFLVKMLHYSDAMVAATRIINGKQPLTPTATSVLTRSSVVRVAGARVIKVLQESAIFTASSAASLGPSGALDVMVCLHRVCGWNVDSQEARAVLQSLVVCVIPLLATNTFGSLSRKMQSIVSQTRLGPKERAAVRRRSRLRGASRAEEVVLCNIEEHKLHNKRIRAALGLRRLDHAYQSCLDSLAAEPSAAVFTGFQLCCMAAVSSGSSPSCFRSAACVFGEAVVSHLAAAAPPPSSLDSVMALTMTAAAVLSTAHVTKPRRDTSPMNNGELPNEHRILSGVLQYFCQHLTWMFSGCVAADATTDTVPDTSRSTTEATPTLKHVALLCDVAAQLRSDAHLRKDLQEQVVEMLRMQRAFLISRNEVWWKNERTTVSADALFTVVDCYETYGVADKPLLELLHRNM